VGFFRLIAIPILPGRARRFNFHPQYSSSPWRSLIVLPGNPTPEPSCGVWFICTKLRLKTKTRLRGRPKIPPLFVRWWVEFGAAPLPPSFLLGPIPLHSWPSSFVHCVPPRSPRPSERRKTFGGAFQRRWRRNQPTHLQKSGSPAYLYVLCAVQESPSSSSLNCQLVRGASFLCPKGNRLNCRIAPSFPAKRPSFFFLVPLHAPAAMPFLLSWATPAFPCSGPRNISKLLFTLLTLNYCVHVHLS